MKIATEKYHHKYFMGMPQVTRAGQPWDEQEDQSLREDFAAGDSIGDLATKHQRTAGAIRSRLERLGIALSEE